METAGIAGEADIPSVTRFRWDGGPERVVDVMGDALGPTIERVAGKL